MQKDYTIYSDTTSEIEFTINCSEEVLSNTLATGGKKYLEGNYEKFKYYIENDTPIKLPDRPVGLYTLDNVTKTWQLDIIAVENNIKNTRNQLLQESDWTDTVSAQTRLGETLYNAWQGYRQQLRDIPLQSGYPLDVIFPTLPQQ